MPKTILHTAHNPVFIGSVRIDEGLGRAEREPLGWEKLYMKYDFTKFK